jgi:hypothetical protein
MSILSLIKPIVGKPDATEDVKINNALTAIETWANGSIGTSNLETKAGITEEQLASAVRVLLNSKTGGLGIFSYASNVEAKSGELLRVTATATVILPAPTLNALVGVICTGGETTIETRISSGAHIFGDFTINSVSIKLLQYQHVILQSDGTNWYITAGEPKQEQKYSAQTEHLATNAGYEVEPSTSRPALVTVTPVGVGELIYSVGGVVVAKNPAETKVPFQLRVPAATKLKIEASVNTIVKTSTLLL